MGYRRGFKTEANDLSNEIRSELGLNPLDPFDPRELAAYLDIPIIGLTSFVSSKPIVSHLLVVEPEVFSAVTVFRGTRRTIVHNDAHSPGRQNSNLAHELSHALLLHPPTPFLDDIGCRNWDQDIEDEAAWLGSTLLLTEAATIAIAKGQWNLSSASTFFNVSMPMVRFRMNATGAYVRVARFRSKS